MKIRAANLTDLDKYFEWTNDPLVRAESFYSSQIEYDEHVNWFGRMLTRSDVMMFVFEEDSNLVGQVRIQGKDEVIIGLSIDKLYRGQGKGSEMIALALKEYFLLNRSVKFINAYIREKNFASIRSFEKSGFIYLKKGMVNNIECLVYQYINE